MTVDYLAWESDCGVGIDLSNVGDVKAALSTVVSWQKPVAWLHISANQIEMNVLDELTEIGHIEAIDFGIALPEDEIISALVSCVEIECIHVVNESMRRALVAVLNRRLRNVSSAIQILVKEEDPSWRPSVSELREDDHGAGNE